MADAQEIHPWRVLVLCWLAVAAAGLLALEVPVLKRIEYQLYDFQQRYLRVNYPRTAAMDVALVGIDETTVSTVEPPLSLWHEQFGDLIQAVAVGEGQVLAFDLVLPERSYDAFLGRPHDQTLLKAMVAARNRLPVVFGRTLNASGKLLDINKRFLAVMGKDGFGMVTQVQELDGVVRRFLDDEFESELDMHSLVGQMARQVGRPVENGWIDYTIGHPIDYVPMIQVLDWYRGWRDDDDPESLAALRDAFAGKAVFVGGVLPFVDRHFQPVVLAGWGEDNHYAPGVLIHMQAFRSMVSDRLVQSIPLGWGVLLTLVAAGVVFLWGRPIVAPVAVLLLALATVVTSGALFLQGWRLPMMPLILPAALGWLVIGIWHAVLNLREKQRLKGAFAGYVSPAILDDILDGSIRPELGGESREVCVLFADIRGFTTLSESLSPERVLALLNRYFDRVTPVIHECGGTLDKYMGDGIMALFGAPQDLDQPARAAYRAAREMQIEVDRLNSELEAEGKPRVEIGVGLSLGPVVVGHVGAQSRFEYSAIGDAVNVAARVEGLTRKCECFIVITERVAEQLDERDRDELVDLGRQELKGHTPISVYGWGMLNLGEPQASGDAATV